MTRIRKFGVYACSTRVAKEDNQIPLITDRSLRGGSSLCVDVKRQSRLPAFHESTLEGILGREATAEFRSRLSAEQQETLQLFFFEGYALKEIAERTGRSLVLVRSHYYRGLERLREIVIGERPRAK